MRGGLGRVRSGAPGGALRIEALTPLRNIRQQKRRKSAARKAARRPHAAASNVGNPVSASGQGRGVSAPRSGSFRLSRSGPAPPPIRLRPGARGACRPGPSRFAARKCGSAPLSPTKPLYRSGFSYLSPEAPGSKYHFETIPPRVPVKVPI